jgi:uncharacterized protein
MSVPCSQPHPPQLPDLSPAERSALLRLARDTIAAHLQRASLPVIESSPIFAQPAGAFVTVTVGGDLRGCIGVPEARRPLAEVIRHCAHAAAFEDPRFPPIRTGDLPRLGVEISVLSRMTPLEALGHIVIGRHGLVAARGWRRGLLLPQVAVERGWTAEEFLCHTCRKAGLPPDAWRRDARIEMFEAVVFGDPEPDEGHAPPSAGAPARPTSEPHRNPRDRDDESQA